MNPQRDLIFDLGLNKGEDSLFYLRKGFRVVAIEANPILASETAKSLSTWTAADRLTILNCGVWNEKATLTFYENLDNDHWSSFYRGAGTRLNTRFQEHQIECIRI